MIYGVLANEKVKLLLENMFSAITPCDEKVLKKFKNGIF